MLKPATLVLVGLASAAAIAHAFRAPFPGPGDTRAGGFLTPPEGSLQRDLSIVFLTGQMHRARVYEEVAGRMRLLNTL